MKFLSLTMRIDYIYNLSDRKQFYIQDFPRSFENFFMKAIEYFLLVPITSPKHEKGFWEFETITQNRDSVDRFSYFRDTTWEYM